MTFSGTLTVLWKALLRVSVRQKKLLACHARRNKHAISRKGGTSLFDFS